MLNSNHNHGGETCLDKNLGFVLHRVRTTDKDIQSGRWMLGLLKGSLSLCQGEGRKLLMLEINVLIGFSGSILAQVLARFGDQA